MTHFFKALTLKKTLNIFSFLLFVSFSNTIQAQAEEDLLPPEKAFALKAWIENDHVVAEFNVAEKYYLYRDSLSFTLDTDGVEFGNPMATDGIIKTDEFFGEVEVYYDKATVTLPLVYTGLIKPAEISIKTSLQGCADAGVCYPPLYQVLTMDTASSTIVYPVTYQYKPEPKNNNIATESLESLDKILTQLTNTVNKDNVDNAINSVKETVAPIVEPVIKPLQNAIQKEPGTQQESSMDPLGLLQALGSDLGLTDDDEIPSPDQAFSLTATLDKNNIVQTVIAIHPSTYLYKDKMKIELVDGKGHETGAVTLPKGKEKTDEFFGDIVVFEKQLKTSIPIITELNASSQLVIAYGYQGCVEDKICYPPLTKYLLVDLNDRSIVITDEQPGINNVQATTASSVETIKAAFPADQQNYAATDNKASVNNNASNISKPAASEPVTTTIKRSVPTDEDQSEQSQFASIIADGNIIIIIGSFFLAGLLLTFTPCVFPMVPIISGIIAGQGDNITTKKAFSLSLVYVLSMAGTYAIAGFIVGKFGAEYNIQAWMQDPIILSIFAGIFVLLSLSMFGFYDIQMPQFIQNKLNNLSSKQQGGNIAGVGIMGSLSALIVGPCITAPLVGALLFISQSGDPSLGALALFALGLGMGLPLLIVGTSAGKYLPKAGSWMDTVKAFFGVSLLAVAIWMLDRFLANEITMVLIAMLLIGSGVYITSAPVKENITGWHRMGRSIGFLLTLYGSLYIIGMAAGGKDLIQPLKGIIKINAGSATGPVKEEHVNFQQIKGQQGLKEALAQHKGSIVMLDFYADWCISCIEMEKYVFSNPKVLEILKDVVALQTDVTPNDSIDKKFMSSLNIYGPPAIIFYDKSGVEIPGTRIVGEMSAEEFIAHVKKVLAKTQ